MRLLRIEDRLPRFLEMIEIGPDEVVPEPEPEPTPQPEPTPETEATAEPDVSPTAVGQ
jgi:hypothetical protein